MSSNMSSRSVVNVTQVIDGERFGRFQLAVTVWCGVLAMLDGFDNAAIAFVAPVIAPEWGVPVAAFGPVFAAGLFGSMLGSLASGPLADRLGRKAVVLICTFIFGLFALATAWAESIQHLYVLRFLTGLGVGGLFPTVIALTSEYAPQRKRHAATALMTLGFALGAGGGGFIGAAIIANMGWRSLFIIGGVLPLVLLPVVLWALPESIRFLIARGRDAAKIATLLNRLIGRNSYAATDHFTLAEAPLSGSGMRHLFSEGRGINTAVLWLIFFCNMLMTYSLVNWLPAILRQAGLSLETALRISGAIAWAGVATTLLLGSIVDRIGAPRLTTMLYIGAAIAVVLTGIVLGNVPLLWITILAAGACVIGGQSFLNVMPAALYPTGIRSTGIGWAIGVGRTGAIAGPVIIGKLLAAEIAPKYVFFSIAVPALIAAAAMVWLGRRVAKAKQQAMM